MDFIGDGSFMPCEGPKPNPNDLVPEEYSFIRPNPAELNGLFYIVRGPQPFQQKCTKIIKEKKCTSLNAPYTEEQTLEELRLICTDPPKWNDVIEPIENNIGDLLLQMVRNFEYTNVKITIGNVDFYCHTFVLQCYSNYFKKLPLCFKTTLSTEFVTPNAFCKAYQWMIDPMPKVCRTEILELYSAAVYLGIDGIREQCWYYFDDCDIFFENSALALFLEASKCEHNVIKRLMLGRVSKFFLTLVASRNFVELSVGDLIHLIGLNTIGVNSEAEAFLAAARWMLYDWDNRKENIDDVFIHIRYELIDPTFYFFLQHDDGNAPLNELMSYKNITDLFDIGVSYASIEMEYGKDPVALHQKATTLNMRVPQQRQWIYDETCPYHTRPNCTVFHKLTYDAFLDFLRSLCDSEIDHWKTVKNIYDVDVKPCSECDDRKAEKNAKLKNSQVSSESEIEYKFGRCKSSIDNDFDDEEF